MNNNTIITAFPLAKKRLCELSKDELGELTQQYKLSIIFIRQADLQKIKSINKKSNDYSLKHVAELWLRGNSANNGYISSEAFTIAMIHEGFDFQVDYKSETTSILGHSCHFNISAKSVKKAVLEGQYYD